MEDLAGIPVVFELVQVVQEEIAYFTAELGRGFFSELPSDILHRILCGQDIHTLCKEFSNFSQLIRLFDANLSCTFPDYSR